MLQSAFAQSALKQSVATAVRCLATTTHVEPLLNTTATPVGGRFTATMITGDGVGAELLDVVEDIHRFAKTPINFDRVVLNSSLPNLDYAVNDAILSLKRNKVGIKGVLQTPIGRGSAESLNVRIRKELDLYANIVKCRSLPYPTRHSNVDLVIIRENTEGEYSGQEHESVPGIVESLKVITRANSERIAKFAFDYANTHGRKKVTAVHKANIMKLADGTFLSACKRVSEYYPNIAFDAMIIDNCSMQMVSKPHQFDVLVMPNLYGNIVGNIGAGLIGGPGVVPGANIGPTCALFEPGSRHAGRDLCGQGVANPTAFIFSSTLMLRHLQLSEHADRIVGATKRVIKNGKVLPRDMGGNASTQDFVNAIKAEIN